MEEPPLEREVLEAELEDLMRFNETLIRENELFETHLRRTNPALLDDDGKPKRKGAAAKRGQQLNAELAAHPAGVGFERHVTSIVMKLKHISDDLGDDIEANAARILAAAPQAVQRVDGSEEYDRSGFMDGETNNEMNKDAWRGGW